MSKETKEVTQRADTTYAHTLAIKSTHECKVRSTVRARQTDRQNDDAGCKDMLYSLLRYILGRQDIFRNNIYCLGFRYFIRKNDFESIVCEHDRQCGSIMSIIWRLEYPFRTITSIKHNSVCLTCPNLWVWQTKEKWKKEKSAFEFPYWSI